MFCFTNIFVMEFEMSERIKFRLSLLHPRYENWMSKTDLNQTKAEMNVSLSHVQNIWQPKLERSLNLSPFDFWWIFSFGLLQVGKLLKIILIIFIKSEYVHLWPFDEYVDPYTPTCSGLSGALIKAQDRTASGYSSRLQKPDSIMSAG